MPLSDKELEKLWKNRFSDLDERPDYCTVEQWKNRFRVTSKLDRITYENAFTLFDRNGWSWSSGIYYLISTHPQIIQIQKELQNDA